MSDDTPLPFSKRGWTGHITNYRGPPIGMLTLRARKGDRIMVIHKLTPEQVATFDPDLWWLTQTNKEKS